MSESIDYKAFKRNWPEPRDRIDRIENVVVVGMPDVNSCIGGKECWLEFKSPTEPKRATTKLFGSNHKVSQEQMNWFKRQSNAGGEAYFMIVTDKRWLLIHGEWADQINEFTVGELILKSKWHFKKPARGKEQWELLRTILINS